MAIILQMTFSIVFFRMKIIIFWFKYHWSLFLRMQLTRGGGGGGGELPLWESVGMRHGFAPHFRHLDHPPPQILPCLPFHSDLVGSHFESPHFQHVDDLFAPQNWPNLSFHPELVGSHFELRAAHPYQFLPIVAPNWWQAITYTNVNQNLSLSLNELSHFGLVMPYGDTDLGQHWLRWWLGVWWHQVITYTNIDLS